MNEVLDRIARNLDLESPLNQQLRLEFGYACVRRVEQYLEEPAVLVCMRKLGAFLEGAITREDLRRSAREAEQLANQHHGSRSLDGAGHAAVSATYAVAHAMAGRALQAADYAAYAAVYGQGGYGAVADRQSFDPEFSWQASCLEELARR